MEETFQFVTDTATLCIFDLAALKHRMDDDTDWWSIPADELAEVNLGNVAFVGLGGDGLYDVRILPAVSEPARLALKLACPSGRVFVGAGEEVTSEGLEPECVRGGTFVDLTPGSYVVYVARLGVATLGIAFSGSQGEAKNSFNKPLSLA